ncbi:MAG: hypothetical protein R3D98_15995 [Candidatus Krumholzibacteriia bacterium]
MQCLLQFDPLQFLFGVREDAVGDSAGDFPQDAQDLSNHGALLSGLR